MKTERARAYKNEEKDTQLVTKLKKSSELNKRAQAGLWDRNKRSGNGRSKTEIEKRVTASPIALFQILYRAPSFLFQEFLSSLHS